MEIIEVAGWRIYVEERKNASENMLDSVFQLSADADIFYVFF